MHATLTIRRFRLFEIEYGSAGRNLFTAKGKAGELQFLSGLQHRHCAIRCPKSIPKKTFPRPAELICLLSAMHFAKLSRCSRVRQGRHSKLIAPCPSEDAPENGHGATFASRRYHSLDS
jgi:hypothetical protein